MNHIIFEGYLLISQFNDNLNKLEKKQIIFLKQSEIHTISRTTVTLINQNTKFKPDELICQKIFKQKLKFKIISDLPCAKKTECNEYKQSTTIDLSQFAFLTSKEELFKIDLTENRLSAVNE